MERAAEIGGRSLARMSSEFDPFGYKTAFRVVNRQNAIIEAQSRQIRLLLQQENRRLAKENRALKKALEKRQPPPRGKRKKRRKKRRR